MGLFRWAAARRARACRAVEYPCHVGPWVAIVVASWVVLASVATLALFGLDKRAARLGLRRVRERTLLLWALTGGWPGALIGQRLFRHKTVDRAFRLGLMLAIVGNVLAIGMIAWLVATSSARAG